MTNGPRQSSGRFKRPDVGAAFELRNLGFINVGNPLIDRISLYSSWLLIGFVLTVTFLPLPGKESWRIRDILLTLFLYFLYVIVLEIFSRSSAAAYDLMRWRVLRIVVNIAVITVIVYFSSGAESYFWCLYAFPLVQANIYLRNSGIVTILALILGVYWPTSLAFYQFNSGNVALFSVLIAHSLMLLLLAAILRWLFSAARENRRVEYEIDEALQSGNLEIASQTNLEELLRKIVQYAAEILHAKGGGVYEYYPERAELTVVADWGGRNSIKGHTLKKGEGMAGRVVEHGQPMIVPDYAIWPFRSPDIESDLFHAVLEVPLVQGDRTLGVLYVTDDEKSRTFSERDASILSRFASHAAITIANVKTYEKTKRSVAQLELVNEISARITHATSIEGILEVMLKEALKAVDTSDGSIMIFDPITNELEIKAWIVNGSIRDPKSHKRFGNTEGIAGHVADTLRPYNCTDTQSDQHYAPSDTGRPLRSILSVPIVSNRKLHFLINADSNEPGRFVAADIELFSNLGGHAATLIESLRLREFALSLSSLTLEDLHHQIVESAYRLIGADTVALFVIKEDGKLMLVARYPPTGEGDIGLVSADGLIMHVVASRKGEIILDADLDKRVDPILRQMGIKSLVGVPLTVRLNHDGKGSFQAVGVLIAGAKQKCEYTSREKQFLNSLATQAAVAIMQARLHKKVLSERDYQQSLLDSALDAIIAVDENGLIKEFNPTAERILGYSKNEVMGRNVAFLYAGGVKAAREVMRRLHRGKPQGRLINYFTHARAKNGDVIPVRLSVCLVEGGSVGFFRDQRHIERMQEHVQSLKVRATTGQAIAEHDELSKILQAIAEEAIARLQADVVWVYYYDQATSDFSFPAVKAGSNCKDERAEEFLRPHLQQLVDASKVYFGEHARDDGHIGSAFAEIEDFYSLIAAPLMIQNVAVGVVLCGYRALRPFEDQEQMIALLFISNAANEIYHAGSRRAVTELLDSLIQGSLGLSTGLSYDVALQNVLENAVKSTSAKYGALGIKSPTGRIHPFLHTGLPEKLADRLSPNPPSGKGLLGTLLTGHEVINVDDVQKHVDHTDFGDPEHPTITSFLGRSITVGRGSVGNIYLANKKNADRFTEEDEQTLRIFANDAADIFQWFSNRQKASTQETITIATAILSQLGPAAGERGIEMAAKLGTLAGAVTSDEHRKTLELILEELRQLDAPIASIQEGLHGRVSERFPLDGMLLEVLDKKEKNSTIGFERSITQHCLVRGNKLLLRLACNIMIENAIWGIEKAGRQESGGLITVSCGTESDRVVCTITDNGCGIAKNVLPDLFLWPVTDPRGEPSYGSFIVGVLMTLHKGKVIVKSTVEGEGTTVEFWLPEGTN